VPDSGNQQSCHSFGRRAHRAIGLADGAEIMTIFQRLNQDRAITVLLVTHSDEATALLRQRHHLQPAEADDFSIRNTQEMFSAQEASSPIMSLMLAAIASVSLRVGGIGMMNIMLV
jgi:ABC-type antimicrobial peptide transport system permease subunit